LAREASTDDIGFAADKFSSGDIFVAGNVWPMLSEDAPCIGFDLTERDGSHSGSFEPEAEAANS